MATPCHTLAKDLENPEATASSSHSPARSKLQRVIVLTEICFEKKCEKKYVFVTATES
jgi:hypothetical protein